MGTLRARFHPARTRFASSWLAFLVLLLLQQRVCALAPVKGPWTEFKTEPQARAAIISIRNVTDDRSKLQPGLTFLSPYGLKEWGLQIFDDQGELVWFDNRWAQGTRAQCFQVCDYLDQKDSHICWSQGGWGGGHNRVFNQHYKPVNKWGSTKGLQPLNNHEFNMLPGGNSFIQMAYIRRHMDLRPYGGKKGGRILDGCFQEINTKTGRQQFRWCWLDHFPIWETYIFLQVPGNKVNLSSNVGGKGTVYNPWDFMHLNAIDKNEEGDYIISARHMNQIVKLAGNNNNLGLKPGTPIWRLGGKSSDFEIDGDALFSRQHHCRFVSTGKNETVLTLFNNAWEGINEASARHSSGLMLTLNNQTMKAHLKQMYPHPDNKLSPAQGSVQVLPNGNVYVGWGGRASYSEFTQNGTLLFHADFNQGPVGYRVRKYHWEGKPLQPPKLLAFCRSCEKSSSNTSPLYAYVSWNGATEVSSWRFAISTNPHFFKAKQLANAGPWLTFGTYPRTGFETQVELSASLMSTIAGPNTNFVPYVRVEALDANGTVIKNGVTYAETFVPSSEIAGKCNKEGCFPHKHFGYDAKFSAAKQCGRTMVLYALVALIICAGLESLEIVVMRVLGEVALRDTPAYVSLPSRPGDVTGAEKIEQAKP